MSQIGRNDPCFCGSGKKYKKCCLSFQEAYEREGHIYSKEKMNEKFPSLFSKDEKIRDTEDFGLEKTSKIILDLADDFLQTCSTHFEQSTAIWFTVAAWNISLLDESKREEAIQALTNKLIFKLESNLEEGIETSLDLLRNLIAEKIFNYPHDKRFIADYEILETPNGLHLNVASIVQENKLNIK